MLKLKLQYFGHLMGQADRVIRKDPDAGKDWGQEKKGMTEDEMVGWHYWLNEHEFEQVLRDGEGQGSLVCCSPWGRKESDITEWLHNNKKSWFFEKTNKTNKSSDQHDNEKNEREGIYYQYHE